MGYGLFILISVLGYVSIKLNDTRRFAGIRINQSTASIFLADVQAILTIPTFIMSLIFLKWYYVLLIFVGFGFFVTPFIYREFYLFMDEYGNKAMLIILPMLCILMQIYLMIRFIF